MKSYEKYLLKLLFSRFFVIIFCASIFGIFQEMTKGAILVICSFSQALLITPLWLPIILFQFFPFILFATLFLVLNEIFSGNELVSLKAIGISHRGIAKVFFIFGLFVCIFTLCLSLLYPISTKIFFLKKNEIGVSNLLKVLQPNKLNYLGSYNIIFTDITKDFTINNVTIFQHDNTSAKKKIIFAKHINLGYNQYNELVANCRDVFTLNIDFEKQNNNPVKNDIRLHKSIVIAKNTNVLFDVFFQMKRNFSVSYKNTLRFLNLFELFKEKTNNVYKQAEKAFEIHSRIYTNWFIIFGLISVCSLLLLRQTNRISSRRLLCIVVFFSLLITLIRPFFLFEILRKHLEFIYYSFFVVVITTSCFFLRKNDLFKTNR